MLRNIIPFVPNLPDCGNYTLRPLHHRLNFSLLLFPESFQHLAQTASSAALARLFYHLSTPEGSLAMVIERLRKALINSAYFPECSFQIVRFVIVLESLC